MVEKAATASECGGSTGVSLRGDKERRTSI